MWENGKLEVDGNTFDYLVKHYKEPSEKYGINGGKISKLTIKRDEKLVYSYDRGIDISPADAGTKAALEILLETYN